MSVEQDPRAARSPIELRRAGWTSERLLRQGYNLHEFQRRGLVPW